MDNTGIRMLEETTQNLERRKVRVMPCEARSNVLRKHSGPHRHFRDFGVGLRACDGAGQNTHPACGIDTR